VAEQRHLMPELHPELPSLERRPKPQLRGRHHSAVRPSALLEPNLPPNEIVCLSITHRSLPRRHRAERSPQGAGFMPRPRSIQRSATGVAGSVRPPAKLGPMPTREASVITDNSAGGAGPCPRVQRDRHTTLNDYLPQPRAAAKPRARTRGEVGGAQPAKRASTDGCQRRSPTLSEGAAAEREGLSCPAPSSARPFGPARFLPPPNSVLAAAAAAARGMGEARRFQSAARTSATAALSDCMTS
jgi:hypothetical protein